MHDAFPELVISMIFPAVVHLFKILLEFVDN